MKQRPFKPSRISALLGVACLALLAAGCTSTIDTRGNMVDPDILAQIKPGQSSRAEVQQALGSPSATSTFDRESWYYIGKRTETVAFFDPEILEQRIVVVHFDPNGTVDEVKKLTEDDAQKIQVVDRETPTAGRKLGLLQQLFGNLGRFNTAPTRNQGPVISAPGR